MSSADIKFRVYREGIMAFFDLVDFAELAKYSPNDAFKIARTPNIMFFTGLEDARGQDIYEDDFLVSPPIGGKSLRLQVVRRGGCFTLYMSEPKPYYLTPSALAHHISRGAYVVGNVHEGDLIPAAPPHAEDM